jgi:gliding motility-associated-like protein
VQSGAIIDTALAVQIYVYEAIAGNSLAIRDTLCYDDSPGVLTAGSLSGGNGFYDYTWEAWTESEGWQNRAGTEDLAEGNLQETTLYRRIVISAKVCIDTSNIDTLTVLDTLTGNTFIDPGVDICYGSDAGTLEPDPPAGGDGNFSYQWMESDGIADFTSISGANSPEYSTPVLYDTIYYRREVRYGPTSACIDISNTYPVIVYPAITNNTIDGGSPQHVCYNTQLTLQGIAGLGGGSGEGFNFLWEESDDNAIWTDAAGVNDNSDYSVASVTDTVWYRREVRSGAEDQCIDVSDPILIQLFPQVNGDILSKQDTACSGTSITIDFEGLEGVAPWSISLGVDGINYTETGINTTEGTIGYPVVESGDVSIQEIEDDNGCFADLSGNTGAISLTVFDSPSSIAGEDTETCGLSFTLEAELDGEAGYWSGPGTFADSTNPNSLVTVEDFSAQISHLFEWKEWIWHCRDSATVEISFYEPPEEPVLPEDPTLDYTFEYQLDAPLPLGEGTWLQLSGPEGGVATFEDSTLNNTLVSFTAHLSGEYGLQWTVINGVCPAVSATTLITIGDVELNTGFSPNGDGINDEYIINLSGIGTAELRIIDRWGNLVWHWSDPDQIRWDGKNYKGQDLPEGTYFYILTQESVPYDERGFIELRR